ncbi:MAG: hypothetical protein ACYCV7_00820 [Acidimicrobiales bacterium]
MPILPDLPWLRGVDAWRRELSEEVVALPATLRELREGVDNFQRITSRLLDATDALEQFTQRYGSGLTDARRQIEDINRLLREQMASPATDLVLGAVGGLSDALSSMARMNPLSNRPPAPRSSPPTAGDGGVADR